MKIFNKDRKINFVDDNNVLVGFDNESCCCDYHKPENRPSPEDGWRIRELGEIPVEGDKFFDGVTKAWRVSDFLIGNRLTESNAYVQTKIIQPKEIEPEPMNETKARAVLGDWIREDEGIFDLGHYVSWKPNSETACLDDYFTADQLEAIAWWMRNKGK